MPTALREADWRPVSAGAGCVGGGDVGPGRPRPAHQSRPPPAGADARRRSQCGRPARCMSILRVPAGMPLAEVLSQMGLPSNTTVAVTGGTGTLHHFLAHYDRFVLAEAQLPRAAGRHRLVVRRPTPRARLRSRPAAGRLRIARARHHPDHAGAALAVEFQHDLAGIGIGQCPCPSLRSSRSDRQPVEVADHRGGQRGRQSCPIRRQCRSCGYLF